MPPFNPFVGIMNGSGSPASEQFMQEGLAAAYSGGSSTESAQTALNKADHPNNTEYWLSEIQKRADNGDVSAIEKLFEYYATLDKEKTSRDWTAQREDTAYQRLVTDLKKAGISPYVLSGATPFASSFQGSSVNGSQMTTRQNNRDTVAATNSKTGESLLAAVIAALGLVVAAIF